MAKCIISDCKDCPYADAQICDTALTKDALEAIEELEAQLKSEPVECDIYVDFERVGQIARCGNCGEKLVFTRQKYCHECGKAVKWDA